MTEWVNAIGEIGVYAFAILALGKYIIRQDNRYDKIINQMRRTVDNNTDVIKELIMHLKERE